MMILNPMTVYSKLMYSGFGCVSFHCHFFFTMILWRVDFIEIEFLKELEHFKNILLFSSEILFGVFFISLNFLKDKIILKRLQEKLGVQELKWQKLKYLWLQRTVDVDQHNYISLAKDLDTMFELRKKYKSNLFLSWDNIVGLIYTTDAKNRIIAMLIAISAATIALSISAGANINYVFELFHENGLYDFIKWDFFNFHYSDVLLFWCETRCSDDICCLVSAI